MSSLLPTRAKPVAAPRLRSIPALFLVFSVAAGLAGAQTITTVAGGGIANGTPANNAQLGVLSGIATDLAGNLYFSDQSNRVSKISNGVITVVAGNGAAGFSGDGGLAVNAQLSNPTRLAADPFGNLYIADMGNGRIRKVTNGVISTIAGTGVLGYSGDGSWAVNAAVNPLDITVDTAGNLYIADGRRVREISAGMITTVVGNGNAGYSGEGGPPLSASLSATSVTVDLFGNLYIADIPDARILYVCSGIISTAAGFGVPGFFGDNGPANVAQVNPFSVAVDSVDNLYFSDSTNHRVRKLSHAIVTAAAGNGTAGFSGDGGLAPYGELNAPGSVAVDALGRLFIADTGNHRIRMMTPQGPPLQFTPVTPCRVMDTRTGSGYTGPFGPPFLAGGSTRSIPIPSSVCNIPASAQAYSLNVTISPRASTFTYLTLWPTGQPQPLVSTLNSYDASVLANAAIVPSDVNGSINVFVTNDTDLIIDINGYFAPPSASSLQFYPLSPCRILDTRNAVGTFGGPSLVGGVSRDFPVLSGPCSGIPSSVQAYSLNITIVPKGPLYYLTAFPTGQPQPFVSTLNSYDGTVLANSAILPAGANGSISFYAVQNTDLVVDINGYYAPPSANGLNFYAATPCRLVDTRFSAGPVGLFGPVLADLATRSFPLAQGPCGLPAAAGAYSLNVTAMPPGILYYLTLWPTGSIQPFVSTLNDYKGLPTANAAVVPVGANGAVSVFARNASNVILDSSGYFAK